MAISIPTHSFETGMAKRRAAGAGLKLAMNTSEDTKPWQWWIGSSAQQVLSPGLKEVYSWLGDDILALLKST